MMKYHKNNTPVGKIYWVRKECKDGLVCDKVVLWHMLLVTNRFKEGGTWMVEVATVRTLIAKSQVLVVLLTSGRLPAVSQKEPTATIMLASYGGNNTYVASRFFIYAENLAKRILWLTSAKPTFDLTNSRNSHLILWSLCTRLMPWSSWN